MTSERVSSEPSARTTAVVVWLWVLLGAAVRVWAAQGDLWFDEVLSVTAARELASPFGVFTLAADNNHHLNTLWQWFVAGAGGSLGARLLAIATGTATIALAAFAFPSNRPWARIIAATLVATSFPLVTYASEARGYAPMLCCGFGALVLLRRALSLHGRAAAIAFGVVCILGFLSHLSFSMFYVAFAVWSCRVVVTQRLGVARALRALLRLHGLPLVFLTVFYSVSLRDIAVLGAPPRSLFATLGEVSALALGVPLSSELLLASALAAALLFGVALAKEWRAGSDLWIFQLFAIAVVPALLILLRSPEFVYPRYFLAPLAVFSLLLASLLGRFVASGGVARFAAVGICLAMFVGNAVEIGRFLGPQRGAYRAAVAAMLADEATGPIRYGSDHAYRNASLVEFYAEEIGSDVRFEYVDKQEWASAGPPEFFLRHEFDRTPEAKAFRLLNERYLYRLTAHTPYYGLSGWHWFVYRFERELPPDEASRLIRRD